MKINAVGLACPAPVIKTKEALEEQTADQITVLVDNEAARENVTRFLASKGFTTSARTDNGVFSVEGTASGQTCPVDQAEESPGQETRKIMVLIATDRLGYGDEDLGRKLLLSFIKTLQEMGPDLWRLVFVNNGVKLTVSGSDILPVLQDYETKGLQILVCGTCLTHFNLLKQKKVGQTTNMLDIVSAMQLADKVINI
ncbi:MAG: sulfurtransferase-like selenium metabolism protein YedF [Desulfohalobiaceae bacterium]|nr:sulfurtransferase-like selenium metabolism protein YedF [Desulfohalobiaceae bacterium]